MQGHPLSPNAALVSKYRERLRKLTQRMTKGVQKTIVDFLNKDIVDNYVGNQKSLEDTQRVVLDESLSSQMRIIINDLKRKYKKVFSEKSKLYADDMIEEANQINRKAVNLSFSLLSGGLAVKTAKINEGLSEVMKASKIENISLIESIYNRYFTNIEGDVMRAISSGTLTGLSDELAKRAGITVRRADNIANDQTRKVYNNMNKQRMQSQGLNKYVWRHSSGGQFPRQDHIDMDGEVFSFDDPPVIDKRTGERGIPGQAINCRCFMVPVIEFDDEEELEEFKDAA